MDKPTASAIICTRDRRTSLSECLASMASLDLSDLAFELIVSDNGSRDDTADVVRQFADKAPFPVRYVYESAPGASRARNAGIAAARGDFLLFTDDDCIVARDWAKAAVAILGAAPMQMVGGRVELYDPSHIDVTTKTSLTREVLHDPTGVRGFVHSANLCFSRRVLERIGDFDTRLGAGGRYVAAEDMDLIYRASIGNIPVVYEPSIVVRHNHGRTSWDVWYKLSYGYAFGAGAATMKHLLQGRTHLVKALYWELASIFRSQRGVRAIATHLRLWLAMIQGALHFLVVGRRLPCD
jgi:glycosyltransferase involved in cell wall biosynthesis